MKTTRILVVDDDHHVRQALLEELSETYSVEAVSSGDEAFDVLAMHKFDVVISDLRMPDHDGIEVLEFARKHQQDVVRVLLTGYLDERARTALMAPDAPYKVGKPWHDEIEIVVRRGLEQRERARRLYASVEDALELHSLDQELGAARTDVELAEVIVRRMLGTHGVTSCAAILRVKGREHNLLGGGPITPSGNEWFVELPLDANGDLRIQACGVSESARSLVEYMAHRAQHSCGIREARISALVSPTDTNARLNQLMRQATLGELTSSLLHDLASTMQAFSGALSGLSSFADAQQPELQEALAEATAAGEQAIQLFVQMRKMIREGDVQMRRVRLDRVLDRLLAFVGGSIRERAQLRIDAVPDVEVAINEPLFLQVLANLLRNAAKASPAGGIVDVTFRVTEAELEITVVDDGPGVPPEIADTMFEPFASTAHSGSGLGLAISPYIMQMLGGRMWYRRDLRRGAAFTVTLPRQPAEVGN